MVGELILITEDNEKNRKLMRELLRVTGYQTLESETAEEGIRIARESGPALILMDLQLPGMNGIEALAALRADPVTSRIPVIAVTASAMTHNEATIRAAGFDGYQTKPIGVKEFLRVVREVLDRPREGGRTA